MKIEFTRDSRRTLTIVSKSEFDTFKMLGENMAALSSHPRMIYWDTPIGATIPDLAKYHLYQFHYGTSDLHLTVDYSIMKVIACYTESVVSLLVC